MMLNVELVQLKGTVSTAIGPRETLEAVDAVKVNGVLAGYVDRRPNARLYGMRPNILKEDWLEIAEAVKKLRPEIDTSKVSGVSAEAAALAMGDGEPEEDEENDVE